MNIRIKYHKKGVHDEHGVWLFTLVKNEQYLLPFFLDHYKKIRITNFVVYDDKSTDNTRNILEQEKNCTIIGFDQSFGTKIRIGNDYLPFNHILKNSIHDMFFPTKWALYVDCDEFLFLPENEKDIHSFINTLELSQQYHSFGPMIDFYPERLSKRNYDSKLSPFDGCPYFDKGPIYEWNYKQDRAQTLSGIRLRLKKTMLHEFPNQMSKINNNIIFNGSSVKTPLIKHGQGILRRGAHYTNITPSFENQIALAHFKFCPGIDDKLEDALNNQQYYGKSIEYEFISLMLDKLNHRSLVDDNSILFQGIRSFSEGKIW